MVRNLDIAAVRSFLTVAELGGFTRASTQLHLTQSAVSLQIKRLEETFGRPSFERSVRGVTLTTHGEQFVDHARRLLAANDETWSRINLGAARRRDHPRLARRSALPARAAGYKRIRARPSPGKGAAAVGETITLKERFARGELNVILTTEAEAGPGIVDAAESKVREAASRLREASGVETDRDRR